MERDMADHRLSVLLIDHNEATHRQVAQLLEEARPGFYHLERAIDLDEGLRLVELRRLDLCLVEYPLVAGLLKAAVAQSPPPPIIALLDQQMEGSGEKALQEGAADYLLKEQLQAPLLARSIRYTIQRGRDLAELQERNRDLALLNQVGQLLSATLEHQQVVDRLLEAASRMIGAEGSSVWLLDPEQPGWLSCQAVAKQGERQTLVNLRLPPGQGIAGWVAQNGRSLIVTNAPADPRHSGEVDALAGSHTSSLLAAPLRVRDRTIGVLELINKSSGEFNEADVALVETLAASAAIAIENARLIETLRRQAHDLQAQNEELDAFAHTVAHDLQTPLSVLIGFSELLVWEGKKLSAEETDSSLRAIAHNGRKMSNIINELLLLASVRKADVTAVPLNMGHVVKESLQRLTHLISQRQARLIVPDSWPAALGHAPWVEEVWTNYLSNALKYGGAPPLIELGAAPQEDGLVRFWVRDNGQGLTPQEQSRLFRPFTQLE
ncbi:MAG: GAF domain-containing protein, partial [Chloroflexota bacterium]